MGSDVGWRPAVARPPVGRDPLRAARLFDHTDQLELVPARTRRRPGRDLAFDASADPPDEKQGKADHDEEQQGKFDDDGHTGPTPTGA
ncbi:hypothetical protein GCM10025762_01370 [Haloechinothrix salitolerans]